MLKWLITVCSSAANQLLAYGGYAHHPGTSTDYEVSPYNYANLTAASGGTLLAYGSGHVTAMDNTALYGRQYDYNSQLYDTDCNHSSLSKAKRRVTSSVTSSPPANHGADTCYYKKQRLVDAGYNYDVTTTSSSPSSAAAVADTARYACSHAFDVIDHA